jgi:NADPH:quinone reductase-like Zn-dependent oxidoreductase
VARRLSATPYPPTVPAVKALVLSGSFGLDNLQVEERPDPVPGQGEALLRMLAASLNYRDLRMVQGSYNPRQPLPLVPGSDGVGEVIAVGKGVRRVKVGDRVCPIFARDWLAGEPARDKIRSTLGGPIDGTLSELVVMPAESLVHAPPHLDAAEAACLPCAGVTAWNALVEQGRVTAGDVVLTLGTGGVSIFALQIAKLLGARVIVTSSDDSKLERARNLGADDLINYRLSPDWGKVARELSGGRGVDHVIEVGGAGTIAQSLRAVRPGGTISVIGVLAGTSSELDLLPVLMQNLRLQGVLVGHREHFEALCRAVAQSRLRPVVDRTFPLAEGRRAFEYLASGAHFGKVCVKIAE